MINTSVSKIEHVIYQQCHSSDIPRHTTGQYKCPTKEFLDVTRRSRAGVELPQHEEYEQ